MTGGVRRVGVFGGGFDPPHRAHLALAQAALQQLLLDELRIVPTGDAWHKTRPLSPAADRLAMVQLAFAAFPGVVVDDSELHRAGPTYTVDTLRALQAGQPAAQLFLLMGEDQALGFTSWRDWSAVAQLATLVVAQRGNGTPGAGLAALQALPDVRAQALGMPPMGVSSTEIRTRAAAGLDITPLVPPGVASYIDRHSLYRTA